MTMGGLFAGVGGFELAAQWAGIEPIWSNEIDPFCCAVLMNNFSHEIIEADIKTISNLQAVDIIAGGFPCQPFSTAGKRKGKADNRHLWPQMLRIIQQVKPAWVVAENVRGLLSLEGGLVFEQVCIDLEIEGYEVQTFIIPACAVNAPHRRDRIWIVAYSKDGRKQKESNQNRERVQKCEQNNWTEIRGITPNSNDIKLQGGMQKNGRKKTDGYIASSHARIDRNKGWNNFPTQSPIRDRNDGLPRRLAEAQIKAMGNAIVPQVAYQIFQAINQTHLT